MPEARSMVAQLDSAKGLPDIFEIVKTAVRKSTSSERPWLMLGLANLGGGPEGSIGAFCPIATNMIVLKRSRLRGSRRPTRRSASLEACDRELKNA
jgi:hypothetical protein